MSASDISARTLKRIKQLGLDPLEFLAAQMNDENVPLAARRKVATDLLPYMYPKLSAVDSEVGFADHEEALKELE